MTVQTATNEVSYVGNGVTVAFAIPFRFLSDSHIVAVRMVTATGVETTLVLDSVGADGFSVTGAGSPAGGTLTTITAPAATDTLTITRTVPLTQLQSYVPNTTLPAQTVETALDKLTMIAQQISTENDSLQSHAIMIPPNVSGVSNVMPIPVADTFWGWNSTGMAPRLYTLTDIATTAAFASWNYDTFVGDGTTTDFTLSGAPGNIGNMDVSVDGVTFVPAVDYTLVGTDILFSVAPANLAEILVRYGQSLPVSGSELLEAVQETVTAGDTAVVLSGAGGDDVQMVFYNGILQHPSAYTVAGTTITFTEALPADGSVVAIVSNVPAVGVGAGNIAYTAVGAGATTRRIRARLGDVISVADYGAPSDAVAQAAAVDGLVYWPAGDWTVAGSIAGLHSVRHVGPGVIVRGADRFAPDPDDAATNILYVDPAGSDANDGLTAALPFATIQAALNALALYGPALRGTWTVKLAAGTYTEGALFPTGLRSRGNVTIQGPDVGGTPNVPTAIIDGTSSVYRRGLAGTTGLRVLIKDIKVQDFAATDEAGIEFSHYCRVRLENVHADTCFYGWHFLDWTYYDALGGIIQNCDTGIQELFGVVRNFRPAAGDANRTLIQNCTSYGLKAKEFCTGHLDYAKIDNCNNGVFLTRCSTANLTDCDIYNNTIGAVCTSGASIVDGATTDWGAGTGDANTVKFLMRGASSSVGRNGGENVPAAPYIGLTEKKVGFDNTVVAHTGTAVRTTIYAAIASFVAGDFQAVGGSIRARIYGAATTLAGTCIVELRNAGANVGTVTLPVGANGGFIVDVNLYNTSGGDNQQHFSEARINGVAPVVAAATRTIAFSSAAQVLQVTATLSNSADTVTFRGAEIYTTEA